ncbi:hypothetical protein MNV49_007715 [Pseudohyphozyma bogoriensis]|nr:hypothetical protein MNV49_007715 [Pseudohyphozyma bogoriensis]
MASPLPNPTRIVTGFNESGVGIVRFHEPVAMTELPGSTTKAGLVWLAPDLVADVQTKGDGATITPPGIGHPNGSIFRYLDMAPQSSFPLHFTTSIDYGVVLNGEATMELDDGSMTVLKAGDSVVQNGTIHAWHNRRDDWMRILFVVLPAKPVEINGKPLEGLHLD